MAKLQFEQLYAQVVDENALKPEVETYLGRGRSMQTISVSFLKRFDKMFAELATQVKQSLVTSEYAQVNYITLILT